MERSTSRNLDWLSGSLLFVLIQVASARLVITNWATFLYFSQSIAGLGTILGLALGASRFGRRLVILLTISYTVVLLPFQMTGAVADKLYLDQLTHIARILLTSLNQFLQRKPVSNSLFFVAFVCIAFWFISLAAGYWLVRHKNIFIAILPSSIAILIIQVYDNYRVHASWWLAIFMLIALLLLGREYYLQNRVNWAQRRVFINQEAWSNIFGGLFTIVALAVVIAWLIPTSLSSMQGATDAWSRFTKPLIDHLSNAVSSLQGSYGRASGNYYGAILGLGRDAGQGDTAVFTVQVLNEPASNPRYYWRGRVYDHYINGQWSSSPATIFGFHPNDSNIKIPNPDNRSEALLRFTVQFPSQSLIYAPSQPVWIDRSGNIAAALTDTKLDDVLSWESTSTIQRGGRYQVRAEIANPNVEQLRSASTQYPQWVKDRYLEIPENVKEDIQGLAVKVTAGQDNPFDKASAITNYLRANIQYTLTVPAPPENRDPILWVLFDYKKGFCNYYASAEVLMLRSVGIPARLAVGFAQGQYQNGTFIVRQRDAHAWPEVYFTGIGWVEFEPTVSQDALARPIAPTQANGAPSGTILPQRLTPREGDELITGNPGSSTTANGLPFTQTLPGRALIIASGLLIVALVVFLIQRYRVLTHIPIFLSKTLEQNGITPPTWIETWSRWNQLEPVERSFASINWSLHQLGKPQPMYATPAERSRLLKKLLPSASEDIEALTYEFQSGLFTPRIADVSRARRASLSIVLHTLRARVLNFLDSIDGRDVYSR
jgi:transglutaminase-like putative cysteine protease